MTKVDVILKRAEEGMCPICNRELDKEVVEMPYKGKDIKICKRHTKNQ